MSNKGSRREGLRAASSASRLVHDTIEMRTNTPKDLQQNRRRDVPSNLAEIGDIERCQPRADCHRATCEPGRTSTPRLERQLDLVRRERLGERGRHCDDDNGLIRTYLFGARDNDDRALFWFTALRMDQCRAELPLTIVHVWLSAFRKGVGLVQPFCLPGNIQGASESDQRLV